MAVFRTTLVHFLVSFSLLTLCFHGSNTADVTVGICGTIIDLLNTKKFSGVLSVPMPASMSMYQDPTIERHCDIRIMFGTGHNLQIELFHLDIMPVSIDQTKCSTGLEIFERYSGRNVYGNRLCMEGWEWEDRQIQNRKEKKVIQSSPLTFRLVSEGPYRGTGFKVHFNIFRPEPVCMTKEFRCREHQRCVSDDITCDGWDDCGDESDEGEDAGCGLLTATEIVAVIVGIILFLETVVIIVLFCYKYRRLRKNFIVKSQLSLASSKQNLKPTPEPVLSFPHRFNSMESMTKSNYSKRTGTRHDSDSSIDKAELEKSDRMSYKDNGSERSYRSRQSESKRNGHYQKRRSRASSPSSLNREKTDPVNSSVKGSQPDLGTHSDKDASDKDKVFRDGSRSRDRRYRDRDDRYSDSDDRSPPRRRRSRDRRRYDRSSDDEDYDSDYEYERRRRRSRRSRDRYSRDRYDEDSDYSDNSDNERERRRRRRSRDRYSRDDYSDDDLDHDRRRRSSRDRYRDDREDSDEDRGRGRRRRSSRDRYRDDRDYNDEDRDRDRRRRSSRERDRDHDPDSHDEEDSRPRRRRKPSQERDRRREEYGDNSNDGFSNKENPVVDKDKRRDDYDDDKSSQPSQRRAPSRERDRERDRNRYVHDQNQRSRQEENHRKPEVRRTGSRENIISQQNHQRDTPPRTPPTGEELSWLERQRNAGPPPPSQPSDDNNRGQWKPRTERRKGRKSRKDSPPPVYEDVVPRVELENLGFREEAV